MNVKIAPRPLKGPIDQEVAIAFKDDYFERAKFASYLDGIVSRLNRGVIVINDPWGEGKSWFAKNWVKHLDGKNRCVRIDAFAHDYMDDPFLLITPEIRKMIAGSRRDENATHSNNT